MVARLPLFPPRGFPARKPAPSANGNGTHAPAPPNGQKALTVYPPSMFWTANLAPAADAGTGRDSELTRVAGLDAYRLVALVYAVLTFRATKLVEPPLWVGEETEDGVEWVEDHELSPLLEQPNPDMEMADLLEAVSLYRDTTPGGALLVKNRDRGSRVASLYPFSGDEFRVQEADVGGVRRMFGKFTVRTSQGREREYGPDEVVYFPNPRGSAPLDAVLGHVRIGEAMRRTVSQLLRRAVRPGAVFSFPDKMTDEAFARFRDVIASEYAGFQNAGRALTLEGGATMEQPTANMRELELGPVQGDVEAAVCQVFQTHPALVGAKIALENSSGLSDSLKPAQTLFYDLFAFPTWARLEKTLTRQLLRDVDPNPRRYLKFDTSDVRALQADMGARTVEAQRVADIWTVNERRIYTGQEPLDDADERGEEIGTAPAAPMPGDADPFTRASGRPPAERKDGTKAETAVQSVIFPKTHWESREDCAKWLKAHDFKTYTSRETESSYRFRQRPPGDFDQSSFRNTCLARSGDDCRVSAVVGRLTGGQDGKQAKASRRNARLRRQVAWAVNDALARTLEGSLHLASERLLAADAEHVAGLAAGVGDAKALHAGGKFVWPEAADALPSLYATKAEPLGPLSREDAERLREKAEAYLSGPALDQWRATLWPLIDSASRGAARQAAASLGIDFDLLQPGLLRFVEKEVGFLVTSVTETTRDHVRTAIADGLEAGDGAAQMAGRIRSSSGFSRDRATLIARTESTRATNGAAQESLHSYARETGLTVRKTWITALDSKVRPEHAVMEGETVDIDKPFSNGRFHPDEPNCRCSVTHEVAV